MAVHRQLPICEFCGEITHEAVYLKPIDSHFVGDTFSHWKDLKHSCKGTIAFEKEVKEQASKIFSDPKNKHHLEQYSYLILRPCLWFAKGSEIPQEKFQEYYTEKAIESLIEYGYIQRVKQKTTKK